MATSSTRRGAPAAFRASTAARTTSCAPPRRRVSLILLFLLAGLACQRMTNWQLDSIEFRVQPGKLAAVSADQAKRLHGSQCLWLGWTEPVLYNWVAVGTVHEEGHSPIRISGCDWKDPDTGADVIAGEMSAGPPWRSTGITGNFEGCSGTETPNPFNECRIQTQNCLEETRPCDGAPHSNHPFCGIDCSQRSEWMVTYRLRATASAGANLSPTLYPLRYTRTLARTMTFDSYNSDVSSGSLAWSWGVATAGGVPQENFSPQLFISKVRAFIPSGSAASPTRNYLTLTGIRIGGESGHRDRLDPCDPNPQDSTEITADTCRALVAINPVYRKQGSDWIPNVWELDLLDASHGGNRTDLSQISTVLIEFTITNTQDNDGGPRLEPRQKDFGTIDRNSSPASRSAELLIDNDSSSHKWTVVSVAATGAGASAFNVNLAPPHQPGDQLWPGGSARVAVAVLQDASPGRKSAALDVELRRDDGSMALLQAPLSALVLGPPLLNVAPTSLSYSTFRATNSFPWLRRAIITNDGPQPLSVQDVSLTGSDAAQFQLFDQGGRSPLPRSFTLAGGEGRIVTVAYCPSQRAHHQAQLQISTDAGQATVLLDATAPAAPAPLCTH
jgi:hypothetical protein